MPDTHAHDSLVRRFRFLRDELHGSGPYALAQLQTCWRPKELQALTWADLRNSVLSIEAHGEKRRKAAKRVAISPRLNATLEARRGASYLALMVTASHTLVW